MRTAALALSIVIATLLVRDLYAVHTGWSVTLAILVAGGALVTGAFLLRDAARPRGRRARGALPADPGFPKPPLGAPYRGPL